MNQVKIAAKCRYAVFILAPDTIPSSSMERVGAHAGRRGLLSRRNKGSAKGQQRGPHSGSIVVCGRIRDQNEAAPLRVLVHLWITRCKNEPCITFMLPLLARDIQHRRHNLQAHVDSIMERLEDWINCPTLIPVLQRMAMIGDLVRAPFAWPHMLYHMEQLRDTVLSCPSSPAFVRCLSFPFSFLVLACFLPLSERNNQTCATLEPRIPHPT